jgi:hypothetical protein
MGLADAEANTPSLSDSATPRSSSSFERYCATVRVEVMGGTEMLEVAIGLSIGHRAFRCAYAPGGVQYSADLEEAAVEFHEEHCRGCGDRTRPGLLSDNVVTVAADTEQVGVRRRAGEPYQTARQFECVDKLGAAEGSPDAADVEELVRTASLGPEIVPAATTAELIAVARDAQVRWRCARRLRRFSSRSRPLGASRTRRQRGSPLPGPAQLAETGRSAAAPRI